MFKIISVALMALTLSIANADDHGIGTAVLPDKPMAFAQIQPAKYQPGKGLNDVIAWGESFGKVVEKSGTPYRMTTWTPFYSNQSALPDIAQFDTLFFGMWPSIADFGKGWAGYFEDGAQVQAEVEEIIVPNNQRSMSAMYRLVPGTGQYVPSNGLIRVKGCELSDGKTTADAYGTATKTAKMADDAGVGFNGSFMLIPGPGSAPSQENHVYIVEPFRSVEDYGVGYDKMSGETRRAINAMSAEVMECDLPRLYLSNAVYWPIDS